MLTGSIAVALSASPGGWMADPATGCRVWNPHPQPNESVKWSGPCENGLAHGRGTVQWLKGNINFERDEGEWREGRQTGEGTQVWPSGRYEGSILNSEPHGRGVLTLQGLRYQGEFRSGKPNGTGAMMNLSGEIFQGNWNDGCFRDGERRASVGVSLSGCPWAYHGLPEELNANEVRSRKAIMLDFSSTRRRSNMSRPLTLIVAAGILIAGFSTGPAMAEPKGQTCRMEQQCKWVNFKKICTWVKVCRWPLPHGGPVLYSPVVITSEERTADSSAIRSVCK
jgi:hypothetical protein